MWNPFALPGRRQAADRVPPHQRLTDGFPILHEGTPPTLDLATWDLRVWGEVEAERRFSFHELAALPQRRLVNDFHCVTGWTKLDNVWEGLLFRDLAPLLGIKPEARFVAVYGHLGEDPYGFMANVPLAALLDADVMLATAHNGAPLNVAHGWPLRLVVPKRYAWKSVKWVRGLELLAEDRPGYWESRGYHANAEPFAEERFATSQKPVERMKMRGKDHT